MGTELWHADIVITDDLAKNIIGKQFDELAPVTLKCIGEGWDNKVFLVNEQYIFRFPRREIAAGLIERENVVLKQLQKIVNLKVPNPIYSGKPSDEYPYYFHGYPMIPGLSGCHAELKEHERVKSIAPFAEFLRRLHSIDEAKARGMGAKDQIFDRTDVDNGCVQLLERALKINDRNIAKIDRDIFDEEMQIAKGIQLPKTKVLVHGDLYSRHLMFDKNELIGIIDWGDVGINSPAVDLGVVFSFYPENCHQAFFDIYGAVDQQTLGYARFLGLYSAITVMLYGYDVDDKQLMSEARHAILRINAKLLKNVE